LLRARVYGVTATVLYIDKAGHRQLVRNYEYTPQELVEVDGFVFSKGWDLVLPGIKEERYQIRPIMDGQMNLAYFELLAEIINPRNERVGFCFVELLPGVRNPGKKISFKNLFKRVRVFWPGLSSSRSQNVN